MFHDLRFALRLLGRERRHTTFVCLTMALGIGAATLLFSVTYGVLMKPLPGPNAARLVVLKETRGGNAPGFGAFSLVFRQGSLVAGVGVVAGLAVAATLTRSLATLLYGVPAYGLTTFVAVPVLLFAVSALACLLPARRAAPQDPLRALRG